MLVFVLVASYLQSAHASYAPNRRQISHVDSLVHRWAPLVWLAPGERFFPGGVEKFLENVAPTSPKEVEQMKLAEQLNAKKNVSSSRHARENTDSCGNMCKLDLEKKSSMEKDNKSLPFGVHSKDWFLTGKEDMGTLLQNSSSFIHGYNPLYYSVPVYAIVSHCPPHKATKLPIASHTSQHTHFKHLQATIKKQKEDIPKDDMDLKLRNINHRDENNHASILNSEVLQLNKHTFNTQGHTDEKFETGNIPGPFKSRLRRQDTSKETPNRVQGPNFTVTYWLFFPFSEGKDVCVVETGPRLLGPWPLPLLGGHCLGKRRRYGNHLGDWEHLSIHFVNGQPHSLYTSTHELGAYYKFFNQRNLFRFYKHELREGGRVAGWLQNPKFPPTVYLTKPLQATPAPSIPNVGKPSSDAESMRPTVFAARGSHGLWASPGHHQYVRYPQLTDITGYGTPWATWTNLQILHKTKEKQPNCFKKRNVQNTVENHGNLDNLSQKDYGSGMHTAAATDAAMTNENNSIDGESDCDGKSDWPSWMSYEGRWGEPRKGCHEALSKLGVGGWSCEYSDGPKGIPAKKSHFSCSQF